MNDARWRGIVPERHSHRPPPKRNPGSCSASQREWLPRFELGGHSRFIVEESFAVGAAATATIFVVRRDFFVVERWHGGIK